MHRPATAPRAPTQEALRHAQAGEIGGGAQLEEARPRRPRCSPCFDETGLRHRRFAVLLSGGDSLRVTGSRADAASVLVASQIIRPQGPPIEVDRRLEANDGCSALRWKSPEAKQANPFRSQQERARAASRGEIYP